MGLIAESPVDAQVQNAFPALPGKFSPLQQGLNALSAWFGSHSRETDGPHQLHQNPQRDGNSPSPPQKHFGCMQGQGVNTTSPSGSY